VFEGVLENPKVHNMFGQHVFPDLQVGKVGFKAGMYMASTDELHITIKGKGGHAALPEKNKNPIKVASKLISELYDYFDKEKETRSVFSIGFIKGNGSTNVVPDKVKMMGTLRAMDENWRENAHDKMLNVAEELAKKYHTEIDFEIRKGYPFLENDIPLTEKAIELAKKDNPFVSQNQFLYDIFWLVLQQHLTFYHVHSLSNFHPLHGGFPSFLLYRAPHWWSHYL
jgi:amidohydrolase